MWLSEILCPDLPDIVDGMVTIVGQSVDSLAVYSCSEGFDLIGDDVRVCLENATWNGSAPICQGQFSLQSVHSSK